MRGADKRSRARDARDASSKPPDGLRATRLEVGGEQYVVLSYPAPARDRIPGLSLAESEVLRAAAQGLTNAEIAAMRGRSVFTVQNQLASACRKLGVSSRTEAAAVLARIEPAP